VSGSGCSTVAARSPAVCDDSGPPSIPKADESLFGRVACRGSGLRQKAISKLAGKCETLEKTTGGNPCRSVIIPQSTRILDGRWSRELRASEPRQPPLRRWRIVPRNRVLLIINLELGSRVLAKDHWRLFRSIRNQGSLIRWFLGHPRTVFLPRCWKESNNDEGRRWRTAP
jgi:hypothetical protein